MDASASSLSCCDQDFRCDWIRTQKPSGALTKQELPVYSEQTEFRVGDAAMLAVQEPVWQSAPPLIDRTLWESVWSGYAYALLNAAQVHLSSRCHLNFTPFFKEL